MMDAIIFSQLITLGIVALAAIQIGKWFDKIRLPLITGYLCTGIICGPYAFKLISAEAVREFGFIDEVSLAFIAFSAGSEIYLKELKSRLRPIIMITTGLVVSTFVIGSACFFLLADQIPFAAEMDQFGIIGIAMFCGVILVARSPSSAIAVIKELRARGSFTQTALGVTVIMDFIVIVLFGIISSFNETLFHDYASDVLALLLLVGEVLSAILLGIVCGRIMEWILHLALPYLIKKAVILTFGYLVYAMTHWLGDYSASIMDYELFLEPLLVCMIAGFYITNYSHQRSQFSKHLHQMAKPIYLIFFTLTGVTLQINLVFDLWQITLILFVVRLGAIFLGAGFGSTLSGDSLRVSGLSWMAFVTQAGVGLGLAKEVAVEFPTWGDHFASIMISVIVLNQIVGPSLFKAVIYLVHEAHPKKEENQAHAIKDALIFGLENESVALANQLLSHSWHVRIVTRRQNERKQSENTKVEVLRLPDFELKTLLGIGADHTEAIVTLLSDEDNLRVMELAYEHLGTEIKVVRLNNRDNYSKFTELDALVVLPSTAVVSLLDHFVRAPLSASLFMGLEKDQGILEFEVHNSSFHNMTIRDLYLPMDVHLLSIKRCGAMLHVNADTKLKLYDYVSFVGPWESLEEINAIFQI